MQAELLIEPCKGAQCSLTRSGRLFWRAWQARPDMPETFTCPRTSRKIMRDNTKRCKVTTCKLQTKIKCRNESQTLHRLNNTWLPSAAVCKPPRKSEEPSHNPTRPPRLYLLEPQAPCNSHSSVLRNTSPQHSLLRPSLSLDLSAVSPGSSARHRIYHGHREIRSQHDADCCTMSIPEIHA